MLYILLHDHGGAFDTWPVCLPDNAVGEPDAARRVAEALELEMDDEDHGEFRLVGGWRENEIPVLTRADLWPGDVS